MRISDWSSDVCSSDLLIERFEHVGDEARGAAPQPAAFGRGGEELADRRRDIDAAHPSRDDRGSQEIGTQERGERGADTILVARHDRRMGDRQPERMRSEEHTSELQSLMRNSYAVFCLKKKRTVA